MGKPRTFRVRSHNQLMNQTAPRISFRKNFGKPPGRKFWTRTKRKQNHENNNEFYLSCVRAIRARMLCAFVASVCRADVASPSSCSVCASSKWVKICCTTAGVNKIHVRTGSIEADVATATCPSGYTCSRCAGSRCRSREHLPLSVGWAKPK